MLYFYFVFSQICRLAASTLYDRRAKNTKAAYAFFNRMP